MQFFPLIRRKSNIRKGNIGIFVSAMNKMVIFAGLLFCTKAEGSRVLPNFVIIITDDQDTVLNGLDPMTKTRRYIQEEGTSFANAYTTSPICCPSRSSIFTGLYVHNHGTVNNSLEGGCSSIRWQEIYERRTFAPHLHEAGYRTFYAGKYLNQYGHRKSGGVGHIPRGWDWWLGLVGNSAYYNYTLSINGTGIFRGDTERDYLTDVLQEYSLEFLKDRALDAGKKPFLMVISTPSPHEPFTPAVRHKGRFASLKAPRTKNFNAPVNGSKHWLMRLPPYRLPGKVIEKIDETFRNRWETLLAVDEMVESIVARLKSLDILKRTYIIFTSDNGFHLGQFGMPWDKRLPYETDIKIPLMIAGPQIPKNRTVFHPVLNIDLSPTILDIAGIDPNYKMDGTSFYPIMNNVAGGKFQRNFLVEYHGEGGDKKPGSCYHDSNLKLCAKATSCKCLDSRNNTYTCIRRFGSDVNDIYCAFRDDEQFRELYDLKNDSFQTENLAYGAGKQRLDEYERALNAAAGTPPWRL